MAKDHVKEFEKLLVSDEKLQAKLRAAMDAYTGDKRDEKAVFDAVISPLAEEAGLPFTFEDAKDYASENRELSLEEGDAAAGGVVTCIIVGSVIAPGGTEGVCGKNEEGIVACNYVGVGFAGFM